MNYELAKQLKDAGFIFKEIKTPSSDMQATLIATTGFSNSDLIVFKGEPVVYSLPTLEELIEACGRTNLVIKGAHLLEETGTIDSFYSLMSNPEQLARLWLELYKK
jgi:hypothetical protein